MYRANRGEFSEISADINEAKSSTLIWISGLFDQDTVLIGLLIFLEELAKKIRLNIKIFV